MSWLSCLSDCLPIQDMLREWKVVRTHLWPHENDYSSM